MPFGENKNIKSIIENTHASSRSIENRSQQNRGSSNTELRNQHREENRRYREGQGIYRARERERLASNRYEAFPLSKKTFEQIYDNWAQASNQLDAEWMYIQNANNTQECITKIEKCIKFF